MTINQKEDDPLEYTAVFRYQGNSDVTCDLAILLKRILKIYHFECREILDKNWRKLPQKLVISKSEVHDNLARKSRWKQRASARNSESDI